MAVNFTATIYQVNQNQPLKVPQLLGFPANAVIFRPAEAGVKAYDGVTNLYGIVEVRSSGLNIGNPQYYVIESVSALSVKANA